MSDDESRQINAKVFAALIRKKTETATKIGELNGDLGEKLKHHQEHSNLNRAAFAFIAKLHRMEELKRQSALDALELYLDMAQEHLWGKDEHVGDLVKDAEAEPMEGTAAAREAAQIEANKKAIEGGIKKMKKDRGVKNGRPAEENGAALDDLTSEAAGDDDRDLRPGFLKSGSVEPAVH